MHKQLSNYFFLTTILYISITKLHWLTFNRRQIWDMKCGSWSFLGSAVMHQWKCNIFDKHKLPLGNTYNWSSTCIQFTIVYTWEKHMISHTYTHTVVIILQKSCQVEGRIWIEWLGREWIYGLNLAYISCCKTKCGGFGDMKSLGGEDDFGYRESRPQFICHCPWINLKIHISVDTIYLWLALDNICKPFRLGSS